MKRTVSLLASLLMSALVLPASRAAAGPPPQRDRGVIVQQVRNEHAPFAVRVDVDRPDRIYQNGDEMHVTVQSARAGYLYLLYLSADGELNCLFPNKVQQDNHISAKKEIRVPAPEALFKLRVGPPFGAEVLKAVVTLQPLMPKQLGVKSLTEADLTPLDPGDLKGVAVELCKRPAAWAEHQVHVTVVQKKEVAAPLRRRVGVFIGISVYQDKRIRKLAVSHNDARTAAEVMKSQGKLDELIVLINEEATLAAIKKAICQALVEKTRPGDEIFIYWSGHGARCADDNGDEPDGYDEYLVPFDGCLDDLDAIRRTMLLDDAFGRWLQDLDGRKIVVILDTCHSGGQGHCEKGLGLPDPVPGGDFDFLDDLVAHTKDIGQRETAMLASARASQVAFERREADLSTMTYFLTELLSKADKPVTLTRAFEHVKAEVPAYVEKRFPGTTQTPVLLDHTTPPLYLRP